MTTVNQDYPPHARPRRSQSPHLPPIQDSQAQQANINDQWTHAWRDLQQQVHHNSVALEAQRSHVAELHEAMRSLHGEVGDIWKHLNAVRDEVQTRLDVVRPEKQDVDLLTQHLQAVDLKASGIDGLKVQVDMITQRLRRLEDQQQQQSAGPPVPMGPYHQQGLPPQFQAVQPRSTPSSEYRSQQPAPGGERPPPAHPQHHPESRRDEHGPPTDGRNAPAFRALEPTAGTTSWRSAPSQLPPTPQDLTSAPRHEQPPASSWAAVNSGHGKRPGPPEAGLPQDGPTPSSPKRQKLATLAPRGEGVHAEAPLPPRPTTAESPARFAPGPAHGQPIKFVPFPPNVEAAEAQQEAWRAEHAARGEYAKIRGRKSTSQGDRDEIEMRQEYARSEWSGSQDGYYRHSHHPYAMSPKDGMRGRELQPAGYHAEGHYGTPETPPPSLPDSGKKSRTKPTRNANGILIRKDGRPDMRSISSAQNLRKVHAKKEAERNGDSINDPASANSPNPTSTVNDDRSSIADGSGTHSPITPTADSQIKRPQPVHQGFASVNDLRSDEPRGLREMPNVSAQQDSEADRSPTQQRAYKQEKIAEEGQRQMMDSVMTDSPDARMGERKGFAGEASQRVEQAAMTA